MSNGIVSKNGNVLIVNDTDLTLVGSFSGNNLFFQVASKGGTLTLSDADPSSDFPNPAMLTAAAGGRISLVADNYAILPNSRSKLVDSTITAPTVELAPSSTTINTSLLAGNGLLINTTMLSIIQTNGGTLEVGGFTNLPAGATTPAPSTTAIDIGAPLDLTAIASTLRLDANGPVSQSGGPLTVTALVGSGGAWTLNNAANAVSTLGNVTAASFSLLDSTNLTVAGTLSATTAASITDPLTVTVAGLVNAGAAGLSAHDIDIIGSVNAVTIALNAKGGAINATGVLVADELNGSATTTASLTGTNRIAALGAFTVGTNLMLHDNVDLLIASALNGPQIAIRDPANRISVADGAVITTGGNARPAGPIQSTLEPSTGMPGALFQAASFTQIGNSFVVGQGGGPATLQISITGNARFDPPLGLQAPSTWLILNLTNGTAAGNVFVSALDVSYTTPGSTNLTGTIAGINGGPAAAVGNIAPADQRELPVQRLHHRGRAVSSASTANSDTDTNTEGGGQPEHRPDRDARCDLSAAVARTGSDHQSAQALAHRLADADAAAAAIDRSGRRTAQHHLPGLLNMRAALLQAAVLGLLAGCTQPQPSDYVGGAAGQGVEGISLGKNTSGESCSQLPGDAPNTVAVFCGTWQQPAARIRADRASTEATPVGVATSGDWRDTINLRFVVRHAGCHIDPRQRAGGSAAMQATHRRLAAGGAGRQL